MFNIVKTLLLSTITRSRRPGSGKKAAKPNRGTVLGVEGLEDRIVPTVAFTPVYGAEQAHFTNAGLPTTLKDPPVYLIFWGSYWTTNTTAVVDLTYDFNAVINNSGEAYLSGTEQYKTYGSVNLGDDANPVYQGIPGFTAITSYIDATSEPPANVSSNPEIGDAVSDEVESLINNSEGAVPNPSSTYATPIDVVITPPTTSGVNGQDSFNEPSDLGTSRYHQVNWISTQALGSDPTGLNQDVITSHFSHELVEAMTDPDGVVGGYHVNPGNKWSLSGHSAGDNQLCDAEAGYYFYRVPTGDSSLDGGVVCEAYWSQYGPDAGNFIVPDGNSLTMTIDPDPWVNVDGSLTFNGGTLVVNADQSGIPAAYVGNQQISIDAVQMPGDNLLGASTMMGVQVVMDGQRFDFEPGEVTSIEVDGGSGTQTITVNNTIAGIPTTINNNHNGNMVVDVDPTFGATEAGAVTINNDSPNGNVNVQLAPSGYMSEIQTIVSVIGGGHSTTLGVNDSQDASNTTYTLENSSNTATPAELVIGSDSQFFLNWTKVSTLTLQGGSGNDTYDLSRWQPGRSESQLDLVGGSVPQFDGDGGTTTIVGPALSSNWSLNSAEGGTATFGGRTEKLTCSWNNSSSVTIDGGSSSTVSGNTFYVKDAGIATTINTGQGNDLVYLGESSSTDTGATGETLAGISGGLDINGQGKTNKLFLEDARAAGFESYVVSDSSLTRSGAGTFSYDGISALTLNVGDATGDTVDATPSSSTPMTLGGHSSIVKNKLVVSDVLAVELSGVTQPKVTPIGTDGGKWTFGNRQSITYSYFQLLPPTVTAVSPSTGPTVGHSSVIITGTNFSAATKVSFGGVQALSYSVNSSTQITVIVPPHAAGAVDVTVTTLGGATSPVVSADQFVYVAPVAPTISVTGGPFTFDGTAHAATVVVTGNLNSPDPNPAGNTTVTYMSGSTTLSSPPTGAGTYTVKVSFTSQDPYYTNSTASGTLVIDPAAPTIAANPVTITYGTGLANSQLSGTATALFQGQTGVVPGVFKFVSPGSILNAGVDQSESIQFTPTDHTDYSSVSGTVLVNVSPLQPQASVNAVTLTYGTAIDNSQLSGTATANGVTVSGTFTYTSDLGAILTAGTQQVNVAFTPNSANYSQVATSAQVTVDPATPTVSANPVNISYGTALDNSQLSGTATAIVNGQTVNVPGVFVYTTAVGTVLSTGQGQSESVEFYPTDSTDFSPVGTTVVVNVYQSQLVASVNPVTITVGTALANTQLSGTASFNGQSVSGTFTYTSAAGSLPLAGTQDYDVTFTPDDTVDYSDAATTVQVTVNPATPQLTVNPVNLVFGTEFANSQLSGTATFVSNGQTVPVSGTFTYTVNGIVGATSDVGQFQLGVTFTPNDPGDFTDAFGNAAITISQCTPQVSVNSYSLTYGTAFANSQLSGTATAVIAGQTQSVQGSFTFSDSSILGTLVHAGQEQYEVTFTPTDSTDYATTQSEVTVTVNKATSQITVNPVSITYGTALANSQLSGNAPIVILGVSDTVAGTFTYTSAVGTVFNAGTQTVAVTFTPFDTSDFNNSSSTVQVTINAATPTISTPTSSVNPASVGEQITFTVILAAPSGGTPQGTVTFYAGTTVLGTVNVETVNGKQQASFSISTLSSGTYSITAVYKDTVNSDFDSVTSAALEQIVQNNGGN